MGIFAVVQMAGNGAWISWSVDCLMGVLALRFVIWELGH